MAAVAGRKPGVFQVTKPREDQIEQWLDHWEECTARGQELDLELLCQEHPECLDELRRRIGALTQADLLLSATPCLDTDENLFPTVPQDEILSGHIELTRLKEHAQGAIGKVYVAQDPQLNRKVAIKCLQARHVTNDHYRNRFLIEAEITSRLNHPGVIPVHGVGETKAGCPFYVMPFVEGVTLQQAIDTYYLNCKAYSSIKSNLEFRELLQHFVAICETIGYAHTRGIAHRDLKPENILLGRYGESLVVDWGLAAPFARDPAAKESGEATLVPGEPGLSSLPTSTPGAGTPAYMSPEQASGSIAFHASSDIYSLGAILYCICCGQSPAEGFDGDIQGLKAFIIQQKWPHPRSIQPQCPQAIEAICLKAMSEKPRNRYASAMDLAQEVKRFLADERVKAHRESKFAGVVRFFRQHRRMAQMTCLSVTLAVLALIGSSIQVGLSHRESQRTNTDLLQSAAKLTALTVRMEIDRRWTVLEREASQSRLINRLLSSQGPLDEGQRVPMADLIRDIRQRAMSNGIDAESWFLCNGQGYQLARLPYGSSIGQKYAHRDYFHGNGRDLPDGSMGSPPHILQPYLSIPYASSNDGDLKVALTHPVYSHSEGHESRQFLGVLGMSIKLGDFAILDGNLSPGQMAALALVGQDFLEGEPRVGLILHHPDLQKPSGPIVQRGVPRLPRTLVEALQDHSLGLYFSRYTDPLQPSMEGRWAAAFEPVRLNERAGLKESGTWVVIVQRPN